MAQESNNQNIDSIFSSTSSTQSNNTFNPYVAFIPNQQLAPNYVQPPTNNAFMSPQPFGSNNVNRQNNDVFDIFSTNQPLNPVPATYSKNQNNDPFADFGKLK